MFIGWLEAVIITVPVTCFIIIIITALYLIIRRRFKSNKVDVRQLDTNQPKTTSLEPIHEPRKRPSYQLFNRGSSTKTLFNWADHPTIITDVVENGWSRFAFTSNYPSSSSVRSSSSLFSSVRLTNNINQQRYVEENWEIGLESVDLLQKLQFKSNGSEFSTSNSSTSAKSTMRMVLPVPGPPMIKSFPQEAYFEITVVSCEEDEGVMKRSDGEKAKLLSQQNNSSLIALKNAERLVHVRTRGEGVKMSLGLSVGVGGSMMNKMPGSYAGSIGFHSDGSVYLAGLKLILESAKKDWAQTGKVIGCGFDPRQKKVFFTVDSELFHVIHCKSEDFGMPLYPVLASNIDVTVVVNLGQSRFSYAPANSHRTPNPCFIEPPQARSSPSTLGYEDSKEFFSMGNLDTEWRSHSATVRSATSSNNQHNNYYSNNDRTKEFDEESEAELFEIVLDSTSDGKNT